MKVQGDLNNKLVWYSGHEHGMVHFSNGVLNSGENCLLLSSWLGLNNRHFQATEY